MASPLKRLLFFLFTVCLLRASPALSVPLASTIDRSNDAYGVSGEAVAYQEATSKDPYGPFQRVEGADGPEARIVASEEVAYGPTPDNAALAYNAHGRSDQALMAGSSKGGPGWIKPAVGIGAGASLYALLANGKHGKGGNGDNGLGLGNSGLGGTQGTTSSGGGSAAPEPGTILLLGLGAAGVLGRIKTVRKKK